jgi:hypothetical protein
MAQNNFSEYSFENSKNVEQERSSAKQAGFDPIGLFSEARDVLKQGTQKNASNSFLTPEISFSSDIRTAAVPKIREKSALDGSAEKVINRLKENPLEGIQSALKKLDNLNSASVSKNGQRSHVEINLMQGQTVAPPDVQVRGFRPVASHLSSHLSFDMTPTNGGMMINNMDGFSASVRGPLGRIRHSETTSMFIGKDAHGPFVSSSSDLYMRRRVHSSTTVLRENNFPAGSPMRSAMQHPEALDQLGSMMRMFQKTDDQLKLSMKRAGNSFELNSEAAAGKHVELNFKPEKLPVPVTVNSLDLDKALSATLDQDKDSVGLSNINGLKVNVDIAGLKASLNPISVTLDKDSVKLELKNPADGSILPVAIPVSRLKEAGARK